MKDKQQDKQDKQVVRVKDNRFRSGAGKHKDDKNDYQRKPKHQKSLTVSEDDVAKFSNFGEVLEMFEAQMVEGKQISAYEANLLKMLALKNIVHEKADDSIYIDDKYASLIERRFPEFSGMIRPLSAMGESATCGAAGSGSVSGFSGDFGDVTEGGNYTYPSDMLPEAKITSNLYQFVSSFSSLPTFSEFISLNSAYGGYEGVVELTDGFRYSFFIEYKEENAPK